jgi:hypothetical protein
MKEIELSQGKSTLIDDGDFEQLKTGERGHQSTKEFRGTIKEGNGWLGLK